MGGGARGLGLSFWLVFSCLFGFWYEVGWNECDEGKKKLTLGGERSQVVIDGLYVKRIENQLNSPVTVIGKSSRSRRIVRSILTVRTLKK